MLLRIVSRTRTASAILLCGALALSACGSSEPVAVSDLEVYFADFTDDRNLAMTQFLDAKGDVDEYVESCMNDLGYEWYPSPVPPNLLAYDSTFGTREWAEENGIGVTLLAFPQSFVGPDAAGYDDNAETPGLDADPNASYVASLSADEAVKYEVALHGESMVTADGGCLDDGWLTTSTAQDLSAFEDAFGEKLRTYLVGLDDDPKLGELDSQITACLKEHDWDYDGIDRVQMELESSIGFAKRQFDEGVEVLGPDDQMKLVAIQDHERRLALDLHDCRVRERADETLLEVQNEALTRFVEDNQKDLRKFLDSRAP